MDVHIHVHVYMCTVSTSVGNSICSLYFYIALHILCYGLFICSRTCIRYTYIKTLSSVHPHLQLHTICMHKHALFFSSSLTLPDYTNILYLHTHFTITSFRSHQICLKVARHAFGYQKVLDGDADPEPRDYWALPHRV
jgi:hypothetical protein